MLPLHGVHRPPQLGEGQPGGSQKQSWPLSICYVATHVTLGKSLHCSGLQFHEMGGQDLLANPAGVLWF